VVVGVVEGVGIKGGEGTRGKEEEAAAETNTVGGAAGLLEGAEKEGLVEGK
jgi:hypothetical protein